MLPRLLVALFTPSKCNTTRKEGASLPAVGGYTNGSQPAILKVHKPTYPQYANGAGDENRTRTLSLGS